MYYTRVSQMCVETRALCINIIAYGIHSDLVLRCYSDAILRYYIHIRRGKERERDRERERESRVLISLRHSHGTSNKTHLYWFRRLSKSADSFNLSYEGEVRPFKYPNVLVALQHHAIV